VRQEKREVVIRRVLSGKLSVEEAAALLGLSERQVWRLRRRFEESGAVGLWHRNRGKTPPNKIAEAVRERIVALARSRYEGLNDSHLAELLAEREGIRISRRSLQRVLRAAGIKSPRKHRAPRYRSRRERRPAEGMLVLVDASPHRWFGADRPKASLLAAIDDATGQVLGGIFREEEDAAGYFALLGQLLSGYGVPLAVYSDRHGIFWRSGRERESREEELSGNREPTQLGRAFGELEIELILANSPQAKGRVERLFGTFQDRLVSELRLASITTIAGANAFLPTYLPRHNARFAVAPADPTPAWRPLPTRQSVDAVCCFKYARLVAADSTVRLDGVVLQLPPRARHWSWAGQRVELRQYLDGSFSAHAPGGAELARSAVPQAPPKLRAQPHTRAPIPGVQPLPRRGANSPWRKGWRDWHPAAARRAMIASRGRLA
jgi:transposase